MDMQLRGRHTPILEYIGEYDRLFLVSSCSKTLNVPGLIGSYAVIADQMVRDEFLYQTRKRDFLNSASIFGMHATMVIIRNVTITSISCAIISAEIWSWWNSL